MVKVRVKFAGGRPNRNDDNVVTFIGGVWIAWMHVALRRGRATDGSLRPPRRSEDVAIGYRRSVVHICRTSQFNAEC